eukprot:TRINITY_DN1917_c0_g1_i13.p1 TRINITY_DN1917_c0_g1~~TRINITY_DN1917_c0_g1_i13.p1  ORF type:complete len:230 (-),score=39.06 TRINITY_DN1917_c0_g1_i13:21-710(-)
MGVEQSRRDDLEGVLYVLVYFIRGQLPWQNIKAHNKTDKYKKIMKLKMLTTSDSLFKDCPSEFKKLMKYVKTLKFDDDPDYELIKKDLKAAFENNSLANNGRFDWVEYGLLQEKASAFSFLSRRQQEFSKAELARQRKMSCEVVKDERKKDVRHANLHRMLPTEKNEHNSYAMTPSHRVTQDRLYENVRMADKSQRQVAPPTTNNDDIESTLARAELKKNTVKCSCVIL